MINHMTWLPRAMSCRSISYDNLMRDIIVTSDSDSGGLAVTAEHMSPSLNIPGVTLCHQEWTLIIFHLTPARHKL